MTEALIGLVGVIVGALMTAAKDIWVEWRSRRKNAEYLAIRVVSMLDRFVEGCAGVAGDDGLCCGQPNEAGVCEIQVPAPKFEIQSLDVDWRSIPANLMYEILSFPDLVYGAANRVSGVFEFAGPPDYEEGFEERQYQYSSLGLKASQLSETLRSQYRLPEHHHGDWNPVEYLRETQSRIKEVRSRRNEGRAKFWNSPKD